MSVVFVVDIDGTICDSLSRVKEIAKLKSSGPDLWTDETMAEFLSEENLLKDKIMPGSEIIFKLAERCHASIVFLTGRNDYAREATRKWLTDVFKAPNTIPLIMRPYKQKGDFTADCKEGLFLKYLYSPASTFIFFEDEVETANRYSKYGLVLKSPDCWKAIGNPDD